VGFAVELLVCHTLEILARGFENLYLSAGANALWAAPGCPFAVQPGTRALGITTPAINIEDAG
jgi:hypothetical protein